MPEPLACRIAIATKAPAASTGGSAQVADVAVSRSESNGSSGGAPAITCMHDTATSTDAQSGIDQLDYPSIPGMTGSSGSYTWTSATNTSGGKRFGGSFWRSRAKFCDSAMTLARSIAPRRSSDPSGMISTQESIGFFEQLGPPLFDQVGYLFLATTPAGVERLEQRLSLQRSLGVPCERARVPESVRAYTDEYRHENNDLAGWLDAENVGAAIAAARPVGVDSKTKTDRAGGAGKDLEKVRRFVGAAKITTGGQ